MIIKLKKKACVFCKSGFIVNQSKVILGKVIIFVGYLMHKYFIANIPVLIFILTLIQKLKINVYSDEICKYWC